MTRRANLLARLKARAATALESAGVLDRMRRRRARRGFVPVLTLHRVAGTRTQRFPLAIPEQDLHDLVVGATRRYRVTSWEECAAAAGRRDPTPHMAVTFDDGCVDGYERAWPILRAAGVTAHFCIPTEFVDDDIPLWWEAVAASEPASGVPYPVLRSGEASYGPAAEERIGRLKALPAEEWRSQVERARSQVGTAEGLTRPLSWEQIAEMQRQGARIVGHGHTHAILTRCDDDALQHDLEACQAKCREYLGDTPGLAYPDGAYDARVVAAAREAGFRFAFTTEPDYYRDGRSSMEIPRISVKAAMYEVDGQFCWPLFEAEILGIFDRLLLRRMRGE